MGFEPDYRNTFYAELMEVLRCFKGVGTGVFGTGWFAEPREVNMGVLGVWASGLARGCFEGCWLKEIVSGHLKGYLEGEDEEGKKRIVETLKGGGVYV
jgi:hypothetical protein